MTKRGHVLWITEHVEGRGGAETYVLETARLLKERGVRCSLLYDARARVGPATSTGFEAAFPAVRLDAQLPALAPDLIYVHRIPRACSLDELLTTRAPVVRFLHDHSLFCLREHKYTTVLRHTCTARIGPRCYPCLGMVRVEREAGAIRLASLSSHERELARHRECSAIVVGSRYMRDQAVLHGLAPERVVTLPLYAKAQSSDDVGREEGLVVYAGALTTGKGLDVLIDALPLAQSVRKVVLLGEGPQRAALEARAARVRSKTRVEFHGRTPREELFGWLRRASCLVLPSRQPESFGLVGVEAMSVGTPVVATAIGGVGEWLHDQVTGLAVPPNSPGRLADALDRILSDPTFARRLGEQGRAEQREQFHPDRHVDGLLALFSRVARGAFA